jgi:hypothetical protein
MKNAVEYFENLEHDPKDPNPWMALYFDKSIPFNDRAKAEFLYDSSTKSRQFLLPVVRPLARLSIVIIQMLKMFFPKRFSSPKMLHRILYYAMKYFITPQANYLILRHFNLGSEILQFIRDNTEGAKDITMNPLKPLQLKDVKDNLFLNHDLNLFNFVIRLNKALKENDSAVRPIPHDQLNYAAITVKEFEFENFRRGWTNFVDLSTAIEIFTPVYQLFLTDNDFWRASNSLQFDETVGIYLATILNTPENLMVVNNKHPMIPMVTLQAGYRLTLHGLSTEIAHGLLVKYKQKYSSQSAA